MALFPQTTRPGSYIQTYTGIRFYPLDVRPDDIVIEDIAHALSHICRFTGHSKFFYSVAQHSLYVAERMPPGLELLGLLHDASEAYLCDVARPVKHLRMMDEYRELDCQVQEAIYAKFNLRTPKWASIELKEVDTRMLFTEKEQLMAPLDWGYSFPPYELVIERQHPEVTKALFLEKFYALTEKGGEG